MRRRIGTCLLAVLMLAAVMAPAMAAGTPTGDKAGIYDVTSSSGCTVTPMTKGDASKGEAKAITADANGLYAEAAQLKVTVTGFTGNYYLVLALNDKSSTPTKDNIAYIDQKGEATFNVYPNELKANEEGYHIWLSTNEQKITEVASFKYYEGSATPAFKLGDVDGENGINAYDASLILQYRADPEKKPLTATQLLAADVDGENGVNAYDASLILQFRAGKAIPGLED